MKDSTDHATQDILDATEKRGRKPMSAATPREAQTIAEALVSANQAVALLDERASRVRAVALQMGYQLPGDGVDADLIQRDIAANLRRSVEACLEVGRGLAVLKEACEHGEFGKRLEVLGIEARVSQRFMLAAVKFSNAALAPHLTNAIGSQSKLFELLVLDADEVQELAAGGEVRGLDADDIAGMTRNELRAALKESRATLAAKDRVLADRAERINRLEEQTAQQFKPRPGSEAQTAQEQTLLDELESATLAAWHGLKRTFKAADAAIEGAAREAVQTRARQAVEWLAQELAETVNEFGIQVDFEERVRPSWLTEEALAAVEARQRGETAAAESTAR